MLRAVTFSIALLLFSATCVRAQNTALPSDLNDIVQRQFGPCFKVATERVQTEVKYLHPEPQPEWNPFFTADLDADGVEDAVIVARCKNPLAGQADFNYKVLDPYYTAHGYGDPKITSQFSSADPTPTYLVLVIHGSGPQAWRAATPKAKYVFINLPFVKLSPTHVVHGKHKVEGIALEESEDMSSVVFWDGKKYRWQDVSGVN
jgi:hypothetical protein